MTNKDTLSTIGKILTSEAGDRDAVHIAVQSVIAHEDLEPGDPVTMEQGFAVKTPMEKAIGIADPYINGKIHDGETFWLFLKPNSIVGMKHMWYHPVLDAGEDTSDGIVSLVKDKAEEAIIAIANEVGLSKNRLIEAANNYLEYDDYYHTGTYQESLPVEFWDHFEKYTGRKVPSDKKHSFFTCSC